MEGVVCNRCDSELIERIETIHLDFKDANVDFPEKRLTIFNVKSFYCGVCREITFPNNDKIFQAVRFAVKKNVNTIFGE